MNLNIPHIHLTEIDSTNRFAMDFISKTSPKHGFLIIADYQTDGKGQFGRNWESKRGENLLCSYILDSHFIQLNQIFRLHVWISLSIIKALEDTVKLNYSIKWPNDIFVNNKKLGGILIENVLRGNEIQFSIVGIGLNINQNKFQKALFPSSLLLETGFVFSITLLAEKIQYYIFQIEERLKHDEFTILLDEYNQYLYSKNKNHLFIDLQQNSFEALVKSVEENGRLLLEIEHNEYQFQHGEISFVL